MKDEKEFDEEWRGIWWEVFDERYIIIEQKTMRDTHFSVKMSRK